MFRCFQLLLVFWNLGLFGRFGIRSAICIGLQLEVELMTFSSLLSLLGVSLVMGDG